ncbi:MAG: hypothetical protein GQ581_02605 [Methyloprofundus sp.]|nr:hypothetical protein [Methyloprofundus sp.]
MPRTSNNKIFSHTAKQYWLAWLVALFWNAITWVAIIKGGDNILRAFAESPVFYFFALFPFIGLWVIISAIKQTLAWHKFGKTPVILNPFPGQVGGHCAGYITLPILPKDAQQATLSLSCKHHYYQHSSNGHNSTRVNVIWQDRITLQPDRYGRNKIRLNFIFNPPANLPATEQASQSYHLWQLHIQVPLPGVDYDRLFELPMQKVGAEAAAMHVQIKPRTSAVIAYQDTEVGAIPQIKQTATDTEFYYGYGRSKLMPIILMSFGLGLAAFAYLFFADFLALLPATASLMAVYIGFIALVIFLLGIFLIANSLIIDVGVKGVRKQQRIFGFLLEEKIAANDIVDIISEQNGSSSSGNTTRVWYRLKLLTANGQHVEVGDSLEGQSYADEIQQKMIAALGATWQAASLDDLPKKTKKSIPTWLRWLGKLSSYPFIIAVLYDLNKIFPEIAVLISKIWQ